ncbi:glycosyltransferase family A protein [Flavobacterium adhaerens]|uniref:glycosyltransferase family A protein n=1 Tax=Flavobacterium adhaerens TaxID=3149043 RepID=UPI0032B35587
MIQDVLVTVFVPVYNGEKYLRETLLSIQNQSYKNIEVLLVDDASTDSCKTIIDDFVNSDDRFLFFQKKNGGTVAASWNFIKPEIKGDFVFYASQDDLFSVDLVEKMIAKQKETNADCVLPDMEFYFENIPDNKKIIGLNGDRKCILSGKQACAASLDWTIHGFALVKTTLLSDVFFPKDAFDSDEFVTRKLFLESNKVAFSQGVFYYRQDNPNAITKTFSIKNFYGLNTLFRVFVLIKEHNFDKKYVINSQYSILSRYLQLVVQLQLYTFESDSERREVELFLSDFKQKRLVNAFYFLNFGYALLSFKFKYILLVIIFKIPFLFNFVKEVYVKKHQKNDSNLVRN